MASAFVTRTSHDRSRRASTAALFKRGLAMLVLMLAMQFMQMLGLVHGIVHAGWPPSATRDAQEKISAALFDYFDNDGDTGDVPDAAGLPATTASIPQQDQGAAVTAGATATNPVVAGVKRTHHHHSCVEYDAAAGPAGVHIAFFVPPLLPGTAVFALWQAFGSWDAPFVRHFSSRAPPC